MKKKIIATILTVGTLLSATACGGTVVDGIDKNKTQIYISIYNGGAGYSWIEKQKNVWNAGNEKYEVVLQPEKTSTKTVLNEVTTNSASVDVYYLAEAGYRAAISKDSLEDLSDILTMKVDGTEKTIGDKLTANQAYYNTWKEYASKSGEGMYMLPYSDSFIGLVFDYDAFVENNWLTKASAADAQVTAALTAQGIVYEASGNALTFKSYTGSERVNYTEGDYIMTAGKDGKYGTYDDGQPQTLEEWRTMINKIVSVGSNKALIWTGQYSGYTEDIVAAMMTQYSGLDAYNAYYSFDSKGEEIKMYDGSEKVITPDNGYAVYGLEGYQKAVEFMDTYFNNSRYVHAKSKSNISHSEAQNLYLLGYRNESSNPFSAMIVEGGWWENEARAMFNAIAERDADRGYGKRDYRYMLLPALDGQAGIDGEGNGSVLAVRNSGAIIVPKCSDSGKLAAIKDFLAYTLSDENLRAFTRETGVINSYDYELTEADREEMTPFANTVWDIYHDTENIAMIRPTLDFACSPIKFATSGCHNYYLPVKATVPYSCVIDALEAGASISEIVEGTAGYYNTDKWNDLLGQAKAAGFYS